MRGLVYSGINEMTIKEFPDPIPGAGQVVVDIKATSLCGSDLGSLTNPNHNRNLVMGHEGAGVVSAIGPGVTKAKVGDRVALFHIVNSPRHPRNIRTARSNAAAKTSISSSVL